MKAIQLSEVRLVKYSRLIDRAISEKRYGLATQMAYRCVLEYHRLFLRYSAPHSKSMTENAFQLSVVTVKYLRTQGRFLSRHSSRQLLKLLSTSYYLTNLSKLKWGERDTHIDKATAVLARDQSLAMAKFLMSSVRENVSLRN